MGKYKKENGTTRVGDWLRKAKDIVPDIGEITLETIKSGNPASILGHAVDKIREKAVEKEEAAILLREYEMFKLEFDKEVFGLEVDDRKSARQMYMADNSVQKVMSYLFTGGYFLLLIAGCVFLYSLMKDNIPIDNAAVAIVTAIMTSLGEKMMQILGFHFGGVMRAKEGK